MKEKAKTKKTFQVHFEVSEREHAEIVRDAERMGMSVSQMMRQSYRQYSKRKGDLSPYCI